MLGTPASWVPKFLGVSEDEIPDPTEDEVKRACLNSFAVTASLDNFRYCLVREFPHRTDAVTLTDEMNDTLRQQHGGLCPEDFIRGLFQRGVKYTYSREHKIAAKKVLERWSNRSGIDQEFRIFRLFDYNWRIESALNEALISDIASFMRQWLETQKVSAQTARAHQD